jgi:hypothetical protein
MQNALEQASDCTTILVKHPLCLYIGVDRDKVNLGNA